jgi:hypothetical protein
MSESDDSDIRLIFALRVYLRHRLEVFLQCLFADGLLQSRACDQFLMADGSVRFVGENLDHDVSNGAIDNVLEKLVAIQGGNEVGDF